MQYKIVAGKSIFDTEPGLKAIKAFAQCTDKELKFLFLAYDYETPFRKLPKDQRLKQAAVEAGYSYESGTAYLRKDGRDAISFKSKLLRDARDYFMDEIQAVDLDREMLDAYNEQIGQHNEFLRRRDKKPSEIKLAMEVQQKLPDIVEKRNKLAELVGFKNEFAAEIEREKKQMSTLDKINIEKTKGKK